MYNFHKSLTKNVKSINKKVQYLKHLKFETTFLRKMKLHWTYKQMLFIFFKVLVIRTKPIEQKDILQLELGNIFQEIQQFFEHISSWNTCNHSTIENFHILSYGSNDIDNKVKEALYIKKQKPSFNKHLHQHGASFLPNVFYLEFNYI